jgi:hypothetical protein
LAAGGSSIASVPFVKPFAGPVRRQRSEGTVHAKPVGIMTEDGMTEALNSIDTVWLAWKA